LAQPIVPISRIKNSKKKVSLFGLITTSVRNYLSTLRQIPEERRSRSFTSQQKPAVTHSNSFNRMRLFALCHFLLPLFHVRNSSSTPFSQTLQIHCQTEFHNYKKHNSKQHNCFMTIIFIFIKANFTNNSKSEIPLNNYCTKQVMKYNVSLR